MTKSKVPPKASALEHCEQFCRFADRIYGTSLDATLAMGNIATWYMQTNRARWMAMEDADQKITWDDFNPEVVYTGAIDGRQADLHRTRVNDVIARNTPGGENWEFLASMCVVGLYQVWDDNFRGAIASALGMKTDALQADIFGEVRHLRHAIIHKNGYATAEGSRATLIRAFAEGTPIHLSPDDVQSIASKMKDDARQSLRPIA